MSASFYSASFRSDQRQQTNGLEHHLHSPPPRSLWVPLGAVHSGMCRTAFRVWAVLQSGVFFEWMLWHTNATQRTTTQNDWELYSMLYFFCLMWTTFSLLSEWRIIIDIIAIKDIIARAWYLCYPPPTPPMVYWSGSSRVRIFWPTFGPKFFKSTCLARLFDIYWPSSLSAYWSIFRNRKVRIQMHQLICICSKCMPLTFRQQNLWWLTILTNQILNIQTFIKIIIFYICMCLPSPHFFLKNIFFLL